MTDGMYTTMFLFISASVAILWSLIFLIPTILGVKLQKVGGSKLSIMNKKVKYASVWTEDDTPDQWIIGWWFIGYIHSQQTGHHGGEQKTLYLFATHNWYLKEVLGISKSKKDKPKTFTLYDRTGPYWSLRYESIQVKPPLFESYQNQNEAINKIMSEFDKNDYVVCLLSGKAGIGKSNIPLLMIKNMLDTKKGASLVDSFNPTDPNDIFSTMYRRINPTPEEPLIIVLEEVDNIILKIHQNEIKRHNHLHIQITCKTDWNTWLDRFDKKYYKNIIVIMTTNKTIEWFDDLDPSYLRDGRVNLKIAIA